MKFNCDYFKDRRNLKNQRKRQWHKWFAWYPVKIKHNDCRWLEYVYRSKIISTSYPYLDCYIYDEIHD